MIMEREKYREYRPGMKLSDYYDPERVPLLTMQQLRQLDFPITLRISYERTCDEFLTQLAVNDMLRPLRLHSNLVILLDSQGALIREDNHWMLLFTPNRGEHLTLDENAELYPVLRQLIEKKDEGTVCQVPVPDRSMKTMVTKSAPFCILDEYCKTQPGRFLSVAERIVTDGPEELYQHVPVCHYGELTTVDKDEIENYHTIKSLLEDYIYQFEHQDENGCPAPLSVAIFGSPGSGKSFGVKQLAKSIGKFQVTSLNLSQLKEPSQLGDAMYEAVHSAPKDRIPLIFFDEFDSELNGVPRGWLKYFLAPMQDGEFVKDGRTHLVHGGVFVFAGATASNFNEFIPKEAKAQEGFRAV
ncbi:MAG: AAA family ATPase [Eubacteriales bacterium]|nr:AAA family ATPase [Eubacteriales bacterium]